MTKNAIISMVIGLVIGGLAAWLIMSFNLGGAGTFVLAPQTTPAVTASASTNYPGLPAVDYYNKAGKVPFADIIDHPAAFVVVNRQGQEIRIADIQFNTSQGPKTIKQINDEAIIVARGTAKTDEWGEPTVQELAADCVPGIVFEGGMGWVECQSISGLCHGCYALMDWINNRYRFRGCVCTE